MRRWYDEVMRRRDEEAMRQGFIAFFWLSEKIDFKKK